MLKIIAIYFSDYVLDSHLCNDTVHLCLGLNTTTIFTIFHSAAKFTKIAVFRNARNFRSFRQIRVFLVEPFNEFQLAK